MEFPTNYPPQDSLNMVLIVDKNPELARMTTNLLNIYGFNTIETSNTFEAQSICDELPIMTIITEHQLPDTEDISYCRKVMINMDEKRFLAIPVQRGEQADEIKENINIIAALLSVDTYN